MDWGHPILLAIGFLIGFGIARYFDPRLDTIQAKLEEIINRVKT